MKIFLDNKMAGIEHGHQGVPYGGARWRAPKMVSASNSRMPPSINLKIGMWVSLCDRMTGIEHGHQGAPYGGSRERTTKWFLLFNSRTP